MGRRLPPHRRRRGIAVAVRLSLTPCVRTDPADAVPGVLENVVQPRVAEEAVLSPIDLVARVIDRRPEQDPIRFLLQFRLAYLSPPLSDGRQSDFVGRLASRRYRNACGLGTCPGRNGAGGQLRYLGGRSWREGPIGSK
jgi:hypothetical protein